MPECGCCGERYSMDETHKLVENITEGDDELVWRLAAFCDDCWDAFVKPTLRWLTGGTEWLNAPRDDQKVFDPPSHGAAFTVVEPVTSGTRHVAASTEYGPHTGWRVPAVTACGQTYVTAGHGRVSLPEDHRGHGLAEIGPSNSPIGKDEGCGRCERARPVVFGGGSE